MKYCCEHYSKYSDMFFTVGRDTRAVWLEYEDMRKIHETNTSKYLFHTHYMIITKQI